jgi:hypothetical protein
MVLILGGGLTGLSAALELQALGVSYTLIEVKPRLGGGIRTVRRNGYLFEGGPLGHKRFNKENPAEEWAFMDELGLRGNLIEVGGFQGGDMVDIVGGTETVVHAISARLTGTILTRMAASSLGVVDGRLAVCLENGVLQTADAVVVALPAYVAAHLLYSLVPEESIVLDDFPFEPTVRVSLGFDNDAVPHLRSPAGPRVLCSEITGARHRLPPEGGGVMRVALRPQPGETEADWIAIASAAARPAEPCAAWVWEWPKNWITYSESVARFTKLLPLWRALPRTVVLCGSDYDSDGMESHVRSGKRAARQVVAALARGT